MNYYDLRSIVAKLIPRTTRLSHRAEASGIQEKGRKKSYQEFKLDQKSWVRQERLLNTDEVNSFIEVSCRAAACPMPLNIDTWDGLLCPFGCRYCYANAFRATLYTAFFDNSKTMGFRHCNPDLYKRELDKLMKHRGKDAESLPGGADIARAIAMEIPMRFGIRFEDFLAEEADAGISLELLNYLADNAYPTMINTKSALVGREDYVDALARNAGKAAVHMTLISSNEELLARLEPGAPTYAERLDAMRELAAAGVRVVPRIEPYLVFVNDRPDDVARYIEDVKSIGCSHITFDTYSYTAKNPTIRSAFREIGLDWDRIFLLGADSQALGSLLLHKFMDLFRDEGFSCSTFDMGNVPDNDQAVCCEVGDWFEGGFNYGCAVMAARYVTDQQGSPVCWGDFDAWVRHKGGWLSDALRSDMKVLWNAEGSQSAYSHSWARGLKAIGQDEDGLIWVFDEQSDFRSDLLDGMK